MKIITAGPVLTGVPDLSIIGVPDSVHNRAPGPELFPGNFNPQVRKCWDRLFKDVVFSARLRALSSPDEQWNLCIKSFLASCRSLGENPFQSSYVETENGRITSTLSAQRKHIHKLIAKCGLSDVKYTSASPSINRRKQGFAITVSCRMSVKGHKFSDMSVLASHLVKQGFVQARSGVYEKAVNPETCLRVDTRKGKPVLSYEIACSRHPFIKSWNVVTKAKYAKFVIGKIWKPMVKAHPNGFTHHGV